jgi:hypothetical protein
MARLEFSKNKCATSALTLGRASHHADSRRADR